MPKPVALYIKKTNMGYDLVVKTLDDGVEHVVNTGYISSVTKAYDLFEFLKEKAKKNPDYDIQYVSEYIL